MHSESGTGWVVDTLPFEFRALTECCQANFQSLGSTPRTSRIPSGVQVVLRRSASDLDWQRFSALCERHRVEGLAWHGLRAMDLAVPDSVASVLLERSREIAKDGLEAALASDRIRAKFAVRRTHLLFLKGLTVGQLAYGDSFRKSASDIDILVSPNSLSESASALQELGYRPVIPACDDLATIRRWHDLSKESAWIDVSGSLRVELHTALTDHRDLLRSVGVISPQQAVTVMPGLNLTTLAQDELLAYLCVHGASSAWFRLKWITDFAGIISGFTESELLQLLDRGRELGAGRSVKQALLLACFLFPLLSFDAPLAVALRLDRTAMWLARRSLAQLLAPEPTARAGGTLMIHLTQLMLFPGLRSASGELRRQVAQYWHARRFGAAI
jgi:hypothetical protein